MRGVIDKLLALMPLMFLMLILLLANFYIVGQISPEDIKEVLSEEPETIEETDIEGYTKQIEILEEALHFCEGTNCVTLDGEPHQASEIACQVSNDIFNDFRIYGESERFKSGYCYDKKCIISAAMFTLGDYPYNSGWESIFNRPNPANPLAGLYCHLCYEAPNMIELDETCLNYNFEDKPIGSTTFCISEIDTASGLEKFGNSKCSHIHDGLSYVNPDVWRDHCTDTDYFCHNDMDRVLWLSDSNPEYDIVYDEADFTKYKKDVKPIDFSPSPYMYGIIWDSVNKRYEVVFVRIPGEPTGPADYVENVDDIVSMLDMKTYQRYNPLGHWYNDARSISNTIYLNNTHTVPMSELLSKIEDIAPDLPTCDFSCSSEEDCLRTEPTIADKCQVLWDDDTKNKFLNEFPVRVKTNFNCNLDLDAGIEYAISVKNWYVGHGKDFGFTFCVDKYDRSLTIYELG